MREIVNEIQREKDATRREQLKSKLLKVVGKRNFETVLGPDAFAFSKAGQDDDVDDDVEMADEPDESAMDAVAADKDCDEREEARPKHATKQV